MSTIFLQKIKIYFNFFLMRIITDLYLLGRGGENLCGLLLGATSGESFIHGDNFFIRGY